MDERYSRQVLFPGIGEEGQKKLSESRILMVGCGALGAAHAEALARAGIGFIRLVDRDFVEFSNLQRQTLYTENDARKRIPKAIAAKNRLAEINSSIEVEAHVEDVNPANCEDLCHDIELILDGTDNFQIRYLINDVAIKHDIPWIYGAAVSSYGTTMTIIPGKTPCLRCIFEEIPKAGSAPTCDTAGVIQPIISAVSSTQVTEALKVLTGKTDQLHQSLLQIDVWRSDWRKIRVSKPNADCPCCGARKFEFLDASSQDYLTSLCGRNAVQVRPQNSAQIDLEALAGKLAALGEITVNEYLLRFFVEEYEITVFKDARAIIKGTDDNAAARTVYSKYIGN